ncbi:Mce protein [Nocardia macrotermitis]|uniref:Mce protein n=1 Tax=Nocardia macrotermitis TaxID=2585198 RepID=UPI00129620E4|nr:Mce protein [Nocardia macrotermitis]
MAGVFGWKLSNRDAVDTAAQQALSTAQTYAVTLTSIDSQHIDDDYTHVLDGATGDFKNMYSQSSAQLKKMLIDNKARSVGKVVDASVRSASTDQVVVMLFVDQEITNTVSPDPRIDRSRIIMTMRSVGGRWLASKVEMA